MFAFGMPSGGDWVVIMIIVLIFFGPGRLPDVFKKAGEGIRAFKDASEGKPDAKKGSSEVAEDDDEYEEVVVRRKKKPTQIAADELDDEVATKSSAKAKATS
jgi:sec-independent protein translocase protein TatA